MELMAESGRLVAQAKSTTFKYEWTTSTYFTKSDILKLDGETVWCVGVKHNPRLSRYLLYFVSKCRHHSGFDVQEIFFTTHQTATRMPMILAAREGSTRVFSYEMTDWKTPITCTFWVSVVETVDDYSYQLGDRLLAADLWSSLSNQLFTDIEFLVGDQKFPAHKVIVATRSPVFAAMFQNDMREARTNQVKIEDMEPTVFREFLYFLYTGQLNSVCLNELHQAADKYQVETLKRLCSNQPQNLDASDLTSLVMSL